MTLHYCALVAPDRSSSDYHRACVDKMCYDKNRTWSSHAGDGRILSTTQRGGGGRTTRHWSPLYAFAALLVAPNTLVNAYSGLRGVDDRSTNNFYNVDTVAAVAVEAEEGSKGFFVHKEIDSAFSDQGKHNISVDVKITSKEEHAVIKVDDYSNEEDWDGGESKDDIKDDDPAVLLAEVVDHDSDNVDRYQMEISAIPTTIDNSNDHYHDHAAVVEAGKKDTINVISPPVSAAAALAPVRSANAIKVVPSVESNNLDAGDDANFERMLPVNYCFTTADLKSAVDAYIVEGCSTDSKCATRKKYGKIGSWCTSGVDSMSYLFDQKGTFNDDISNWDVSSVTDMSYMFYNATSFNQNLNKWDVSSVTNMICMFCFATSFDQSLDGWNVRSVIDMTAMFQFATNFNKKLNSWNVSSVTRMYGMFFAALRFNQPLDRWDVRSVFDMATMFTNATSFNQPLDGWVVSSVIHMDYMFDRATSFNQNLCKWGLLSSFPWSSTNMMFTKSGCPNKASPTQALKGPFCANC
ncbi:hypothetical protein ACHAXA_003448 [Cyclostephanos tholiformis]|uniref:Uncharacterized protein n=1 Tax=Cyclostephanos tholiformis TaxID=382380 RepID=A0ABD3R1Z0_9STRA